MFERVYPFGWLGILADVPPVNHELIYANHERGFALASMRSGDAQPLLRPMRRGRRRGVVAGRAVLGRAVPCASGPRRPPGWCAGRRSRRRWRRLRSFVAEPMRHGRLFLAGDAAHIVPPTGAKGMNLAVSDVIFLAEAFERLYRDGRRGGGRRLLGAGAGAGVEGRAVLLVVHRAHPPLPPGRARFERRMQAAELAYIRSSRAAQTALAENYVGLPLT